EEPRLPQRLDRFGRNLAQVLGLLCPLPQHRQQFPDGRDDLAHEQLPNWNVFSLPDQTRTRSSSCRRVVTTSPVDVPTSIGGLRRGALAGLVDLMDVAHAEEEMRRLMAETEAKAARYEEMNRQVSAVSATERSADGLVLVTVDSE